jgi:hypothetical protein
VNWIGHTVDVTVAVGVSVPPPGTGVSVLVEVLDGTVVAEGPPGVCVGTRVGVLVLVGVLVFVEVPVGPGLVGVLEGVLVLVAVEVLPGVIGGVGVEVLHAAAGTKSSFTLVAVMPVLSYPPAVHTRPVAGSLSAAKLRRAVMKGSAVDQVLLLGLYTSTSVEGLGATLPPPSTHNVPSE